MGTRAGKETSASGPAVVQQLPSHVTAGGSSHLLVVTIAHHTVKQVNIRLCCDPHPAGSFSPSHGFCSLMLTHCHSFNSWPCPWSDGGLPAFAIALLGVGSHVTFPGCVILKYCKSLTIILPLDIVSCVILKGNT